MDLNPQSTLEAASTNGSEARSGGEEAVVAPPEVVADDGSGHVLEEEFEDLVEEEVVEDEEISLDTTDEIEGGDETEETPAVLEEDPRESEVSLPTCQPTELPRKDTLENHFKGFVKLDFVSRCSENTPRCSTGETPEDGSEKILRDAPIERESVVVLRTEETKEKNIKDLTREMLRERLGVGQASSGPSSRMSEASEEGYQDDDEDERDSWDGERDSENDMEAAGCSCQTNFCAGSSPFVEQGPMHIEISRELDETPPFDETESPCYSSCGSPTSPPSRKRKLEEGDECSSKKMLPDCERDKTDGRACKLLHKERPPPHVQAWLQEINSWPKAEQNLGLERLLATICDSHQLRLVRQLIEPHFQRDFISLLPKELALYVLSFLEPRDLVRAAQTCSTWRFLAEDNLLWKEKCRESGIKELPRRRKCCTWKSAFMRQHRIEWNWRTQTIRGMQYLRGHDDHVITCLQFAYNRIVSGSDDNTLRVWNFNTGKCLKTLVGHTGGVWSSQMNEKLIISGSTDRTLKVWDAETGQCLHTLYGHTSTVRCMHLHGNKVVSGSRDATLRVWDVVSGECLYVLVGHLAAVRCVQYDGRLVVSGAYDYMVKVWNPEREECLHTLQGHTNRVYSLQFDGIHVVSGSLDTSIRVWDVETGALKHTLMGHQSLTSGMELRDNILVSGNADSTVKVWDITTGQCLQTLSGANKHQSAVTCLQFNRRFVITSSDDGTVKLWDVRTGEFIRNLVTLYSGGSGGVVWRIRANETKLVCAVGSRNGTEETKLVVLDFDVDRPS